jgi:acyl-CoA synthetase (AMP-forming)/AMP-acid ligase II
VNTTDFLNIANAICPERDMVVFEGKRYTYATISDRVNRLTNALIKLGVKKGDRMGFLQVNCSQYIEAYFASAKSGAVFVPLNFKAKTEELSYMLSKAEAKTIFSGSRYMQIIEDMLPELSSVEHVISLEDDNTKHIFYEDLIESSPSQEYIIEIDDDDLTILMYTAGTTDRPKGVPLRHSSFVSYVLENVEPANPDIDERNLLSVPLYHVAGVHAMLAGVYGGRTLVMMRQFEVKEWLKTVHKERVTRAMLVPTMLKWVIDDPDFNICDLKSLKVITYGAAPMHFEVIKKAITSMPWVRFINAFGQTETASTITALGPEDHNLDGTKEEIEKKLKRLESSIGKPLRDVEVKIVDDKGDTLPPFKTGDILARGPRIMTGYWKDEGKTAQVITKDGWLRTSDKGYMDEEGYIYLSGRGDDMIIRGGENISPEELETVLYSHPDIEEAAVIGVPDPEWGQEPRAIVVPKDNRDLSEKEIMEYCRSRLAGFKRPRSVVFVESLPKNQMGKILKKDLREKYGKCRGKIL